MIPEPLPLPEACTRTLAAVETDPLAPGLEAERHLATCRACAEARVIYLAQEEVPETLAPAGYFDRLPGRILGKLPARRHPRLSLLLWPAAAALLLAVGGASFWAGRANRTPVVEATLPKPPGTYEIAVPDTPFQDRDEDAAQLQGLSPEEMKSLLKRLDSQPSTSPAPR